jgi:hypothetical protein
MRSQRSYDKCDSYEQLPRIGWLRKRRWILLESSPRLANPHPRPNGITQSESIAPRNLLVSCNRGSGCVMRRGPAAGLTALLWRQCSAHNSIVSRIERATSRVRRWTTADASVFPPAESDLYQNSHAGQRDKVQLTGSTSRREEAASGVCGASTVQQTSNAGGVMAPRDRPWLHCDCCISCVAHGGPQKRPPRVHVEGRSRTLATPNWCRFGGGLRLRHPKTAECRRSDLRPASTPVRQAQAACANFPSSRACEASLTDSVLSAAL